MRRSEFDRAVSDEFGAARSSFLRHDLTLAEFDGRTVQEALDSGAPAREVWLALCAAMDVPADRRYGVGRLEPRR